MEGLDGAVDVALRMMSDVFSALECDLDCGSGRRDGSKWAGNGNSES